MGIIKIVILIALIKLPDSVKPITRAFVYTLAGFAVSIMFNPFLPTLLASAVSFFLAWFYFWLLEKLEGSFFWWLVMIGGALIGLV